MTKLGKSVTRESASTDRGRPLVVTLHPRHLEIRVKGLRTRYSISYDACMWLAIKRDLEEQRAAKKAARKGGPPVSGAPTKPLPGPGTAPPIIPVMEQDLQLRSVHTVPVADIRHNLRRRDEFRESVAQPWRRIRQLRAHLVALYLVIAGLALALLARF